MSKDCYDISVDKEAVIDLFFRDKINLELQWPQNQASEFIELLLNTPISDILYIIDTADHSQLLSTGLIPQFADLSVIDQVCNIFVDSCMAEINYGDLGYHLIKDARNISAYRKYGENYGKGASLMGLATSKPGIIMPSSLTSAYVILRDSAGKEKLKKLLLLRIPLIQRLLYMGKQTVFNGFKEMQMLSRSTMLRRGQCPKWMLKELGTLNDSDLTYRLRNIVWEQ